MGHRRNTTPTSTGRLFALCMAAAALMLFGCRPADEAASEHQLPETYLGLTLTAMERSFQDGSPGGRIRLPITEWVTSFNPVLAVGTTADQQLFDATFARPIRRDPQTGEWTTELAESFTRTETSIEISLRDDLRWSDGTPITADDAVYSLSVLYLNRAYPTYANERAEVIDGQVTIEQLDERRYVIGATAPHRALYELAALPPLPRHVVEPIITAGGPSAFLTLWSSWHDPGAVVGSGPFVITAVEQQTRIRMERNEHYPLTDASGAALPYLDSLELVVVPIEGEAAALAAGDVDVVRLSASDLRHAADELPQGTRLFADMANSPGTFVAFNLNTRADDGRGLEPSVAEVLGDLRLRTTVASLIDRDTLITTHFDGLGARHVSYLSPASPYAHPDVGALVPVYDRGAAAETLTELLAELDPNPFTSEAPLQIMVNAENPFRIELAEYLADELTELGLPTEAHVEPFRVIAASIYADGEWQMVVLGMDRAADPAAFDDVLPSWGLLHLPEPNQEQPGRPWEQEIDELWRTGEQVLDEQRYTELHHQAQQVFADALPWINVAGPLTYYAATINVGNLMTGAFDLDTMPSARLYLTDPAAEP